MLRFLWRLLDNPAVWRKAQAILGWYTVRAYRRTVTRLLGLTGAETVLDVGCGTGEYSQLLHYGRYVGVDFNPQYVEWANQSYGVEGKTEFFAMDVADVPKLRVAVDAAFCIAVTHHLSDAELQKLVRDVLAVADRFVIVDLVLPPAALNPLSYVLIRMDRGRHGRTRSRLLATIGETGYTVESVAGGFGFPHSVIGISVRPGEGGAGGGSGG